LQHRQEEHTARYHRANDKDVLVKPRLFIDQGQPVRKRLAAEVFADHSQGRRGMLVSDIPAGLAALGMPLEKELVSAFSGQHQLTILSLERWQTVVKRCCAREEARRDTYVPAAPATASDPEKEDAVDESASAFRHIHEPTAADVQTRSQAKKSDFKTVLARYRRQAISNRGKDVTSRSVVDGFLKGPIGTELYTNPHPWWEQEGINYDPNLQRTYGCFSTLLASIYLRRNLTKRP